METAKELSDRNSLTPLTSAADMEIGLNEIRSIESASYTVIDRLREAVFAGGGVRRH